MTNNKRKLHVAQPQAPANVTAQVVITAFTDRNPVFQCSGDPAVALELLSVGLQAVANALRQQFAAKAQADPVDRKREFLGPRETIIYDKGEK
jgi:hypothetical protein